MTTGKYIFSLLSVLVCSAFAGHAQDEIKLSNASFEYPYMESSNKPTCCMGAKGWYSCGQPDLNTPDAQPGNFDVNLPAAGGDFYVGMVARDNDTWEGLSQRLRTPLEADKCYTFSLKASYSDQLVSQSRITREDVKYDKPILIRIWGGSGYCNKGELLAETQVIDHTFWKQYNLKFEPRRNLSYILIEAFYKTPTPIPYNGNVLLDDLSSIVLIPCDEEDQPPVVAVEQPEQPANVNVKPSNPVTEPTPEPNDPIVSIPVPQEDPPIQYGSSNDILKLDRNRISKGEVIRIKDLSFPADSANITEDAYPVLNEIYDFLRANPDVRIEIGGHTNNRCETNFCDELSEKRAQAVSQYLYGKGIRRNRLIYKGYGKRNPVATNATRTGRKRNQRVEIKILNLDG